ncbi:GNAT family N-acetyltransferase [Massilia solisilvae]|uniref:GNAT family N-acetyltransferase n=1 Tax=Massilia solisilvae TaxID=1811225 RepID=A0ABT2BEP5_9BURK|nr:GNAT family N-acetyltransferase [Massilia solisilvae]MCS0606987.1 GNAT family N-acetyltransferase [Massilia solisilvae]
MTGMKQLKLEVRETRDADIDGVIALFCETGSNPYNWCPAKWRHYYRDYPEGRPLSLVALIDGRIVGHYGMLPVRIGEHAAMLGVHAYVAADQRGLTVISALMKDVDQRCQAAGIALICGFANPRFTIVKTTVFKWKATCWLGFQQGIGADDLAAAKGRKFFFNYSAPWYDWRFGAAADQYLSRYVDPQGAVHKQLLKTTPRTVAASIAGAEGWSPNSTYPAGREGEFRQPFSMKVFDERLIAQGILEHGNWSIEMGDSDTFQYTPWSIT